MSRTSDRRYQASRARLKKAGAVCWICGQPIDITLPTYHPLSFSADHVEAVANGGNNRGRLEPAHLACNQRRGARTPDTVRADKHSRQHY